MKLSGVIVFAACSFVCSGVAQPEMPDAGSPSRFNRRMARIQPSANAQRPTSSPFQTSLDAARAASAQRRGDGVQTTRAQLNRFVSSEERTTVSTRASAHITPAAQPASIRR